MLSYMLETYQNVVFLPYLKPVRLEQVDKEYLTLLSELGYEAEAHTVQQAATVSDRYMALCSEFVMLDAVTDVLLGDFQNDFRLEIRITKFKELAEEQRIPKDVLRLIRELKQRDVFSEITFYRLHRLTNRSDYIVAGYIGSPDNSDVSKEYICVGVTSSGSRENERFLIARWAEDLVPFNILEQSKKLREEHAQAIKAQKDVEVLKEQNTLRRQAIMYRVGRPAVAAVGLTVPIILGLWLSVAFFWLFAIVALIGFVCAERYATNCEVESTRREQIYKKAHTLGIDGFQKRSIPDSYRVRVKNFPRVKVIDAPATDPISVYERSKSTV